VGIVLPFVVPKGPNRGWVSRRCVRMLKCDNSFKGFRRK
jgi:hypothetical protein